MPTGSRKSAGADLSALLERLLSSGVEFVLVGGLAAVVQGAPITTLDVDIVHSRSAENVTKLLAFLKSVDATHRRPDDKVLTPRETDLSGAGHSLFATILGPLDVLATIEDGNTYEDLLDKAIEVEFRGYKLPILDLRTLVELKRRSSEPKDKQRLPIMEEALRQLAKADE